MKINSFFTALLCFLGFVTHGLGQVPSLINYQGRLADATGAPVTGSKNFTLSIYDGETEGSLLYSEDIGAVTLDDNGVYSFQFGESGTSQATATKSVGVADGIKNVFNTVLPDSAMGVSSIGDGTYTWTPTNGSSSPTSFIGSYDAASKTASAIYIGAVPEAGTEISVNYQNSSGGIAEALGSGLEHWLELSIDGANQASRTKILAVPFAQVAGKSTEANFLAERQNVRVFLRSGFSGGGSAPTYPLIDAQFIVPSTWKRISKLEITVRRKAQYSFGNTDLSAVDVKLQKWDPQQKSSILIKEFRVYDPSVNLPDRSLHDFSYTLPWDVQLSEDTQYFLEFEGGGQQNSRSDYTAIYATVDLLQR